MINKSFEFNKHKKQCIVYINVTNDNMERSICLEKNTHNNSAPNY